MTVVLSGLDIEAKSEAVLAGLWDRTGGRDRYDAVDVRLIRTDREDARSLEEAMAYLRVTVDDHDPDLVGREFSNAVVELALANIPGFTVTSPPGREAPLVRYWPTLAPQRDSIVVIAAQRSAVPAAGRYADPPLSGPPLPGPRSHPTPPVPDDAGTIEVPIGRLIGARSGDKGGHANLGVWARTDDAYDWLHAFMTTDRLHMLLPDTRPYEIERVDLPNLRAINFVIRGYLGEGVASSTRWDPQAKSLGEYFRSRPVPVPEALLAV